MSSHQLCSPRPQQAGLVASLQRSWPWSCRRGCPEPAMTCLAAAPATKASPGAMSQLAQSQRRQGQTAMLPGLSSVCAPRMPVICKFIVQEQHPTGWSLCVRIFLAQVHRGPKIAPPNPPIHDRHCNLASFGWEFGGTFPTMYRHSTVLSSDQLCGAASANTNDSPCRNICDSARHVPQSSRCVSMLSKHCKLALSI